VAGIRPPANFRTTRLRIYKVAAGERFGRIYLDKYPDPLGFGKSRSRFSDPRRRVEANRFGVLYLGQTLTVCFLEAVLRDQRDGLVGELVLEESELETWRYAEIEVTMPLRLVDLRDNAAVAMGVPSDVHRGSRHALGRAWSAAFYEHPQTPDGIIYPSRLNGQINLAIYGRAVANLRAVRLRRLGDVAELAPVLTDLRVALTTPDPD
jgi:hypothetical protein